jgi:hypothetical protein
VVEEVPCIVVELESPLVDVPRDVFVLFVLVVSPSSVDSPAGLGRGSSEKHATKVNAPATSDVRAIDSEG